MFIIVFGIPFLCCRRRNLHPEYSSFPSGRIYNLDQWKY